ncbi:putative endopeptidase p60 [Pseudoclavibacter triregionum]|nr:putative endopeptidase p60 [Pseudoclavibacter triregionum]
MASLVSVVATEIIDRAAMAPVAELSTFAGEQGDAVRGMSIRAAKPASLVAKRRRRAAAGFAAAASAAAVASTGLLVPAVQQADAASQANLLDAAAQSQADEDAAAEQTVAPTPETQVQTVVTTIVAAPAETVDRVDTADADAGTAAAPVATATASSSSSSASTGTSTSSSTQTASSDDPVSSSASGSYVGSSLLDTALQFNGDNYVLGGEAPGGFDCSGLVAYVLRLHGIDAPHSIPGIAALGTRIDASEAQPGDIMVWPGAGHIGFYAGNGRVFSAVDYGEGVRYGGMWGSYYFVRI